MADNIVKFKLLDSLSLEQQSKYRKLGLTYTSNNESVMPRDTAGNIIMQEGSTKNPLLIIDAVSEQITTKSALRVLDTAFQYFKFPVSVNVTTGSADLNLDLNLEQDPIYARYKPSEARKIAAGGTYSGILMDDIEEGNIQKKTNAYYITKEIKNSGASLRFRITLEHRYDSFNIDELSRCYFSLIKSSPVTGIDRSWKTYQAPDNGAIYQYEVQKLFIDEIIPNEDLNIGDTYSIGAYCTINEEFRYHTINEATTYWVISDARKDVDEWNQENN